MAVELGVEPRDGCLPDSRICRSQKLSVSALPRRRRTERTRIGDGEREELLEDLVDELDRVIARLRDDGVGRKDLTARKSRCSSDIGVIVLDVPHDVIAHELAQAVLCRLGCLQFVSPRSQRWQKGMHSLPEDDVRS